MAIHQFYRLKEIIEKYLPSDQIERIHAAYETAKNAHEGQTRSSGEPYITHPVSVACILADLHLDCEAIMAALLHDVVEDTPVTGDQLRQLYGDTVANLVSGVTKLDKLQFSDYREAQAENFRKMIMAMVSDIRVILIKLADRTHNMRTIGSLRPDKRRRIARETLEIYAPIANRLGIHSIKDELEELCFEVMYPVRSRVIKEAVAYARKNRTGVVDRITGDITARLGKFNVKLVRLTNQQPAPYIIYDRMKTAHEPFHEIIDTYTFCVVTDTIDNCYRSLGVIHNLYKPKPARFMDYIAIPKSNGYQSLHTSVIGPHGVQIDVMIRTDYMDRLDDKGVAAEWAYDLKDDPESSIVQSKAKLWVKNLLELQESVGNSFEFIENVKTDLFPDEIYVFTPEGKIFSLPNGATAVDFAYAVHTDLGNHCVGARVDKMPYPLARPLMSGQSVEIITRSSAVPSAAWLAFVVTSRARSKIRQYLKGINDASAIVLGRRLLMHALGSVRIEDIPQADIDRVVMETHHLDFNDLLHDIALGNEINVIIAQKLMGSRMPVDSPAAGRYGKHAPVKGAFGTVVSFASCCHPIPGDPIVAHVTPGKGVVVHTEGCRNLKGSGADSCMLIEWDMEGCRGMLFPVLVNIVLENRPNILADLAGVITGTGAEIDGIKTEENIDGTTSASVTLGVQGRVHLAEVIKKVRIMPGIAKVSRQRQQ